MNEACPRKVIVNVLERLKEEIENLDNTEIKKVFCGICSTLLPD